MDIFINIGILIAGLIAIFFFAALFVDKHYAIESQITINKPNGEVFNYIKHLKNQEKFSKWVMTDPDMKKSFRGTDGHVGFVYAWDGNKKAGKGEQEITGIKEGERLDIEVRFEKPFEGIANTPFVTEALAANQAKVIWGMNGVNKYPMNMMTLFMKGMLKKDLETSLANLKDLLENNNENQ